MQLYKFAVNIVTYFCGTCFVARLMFVFLITCDIYPYCDLQCLADATTVGWLVHNYALAGALQERL